MRNLILIIFVLGGIKHIHGQEILKENLSKPVVVYWDFEKIKILSEGCYFVDFLGPGAEKHCVWKYYDKSGNLE